MTAAAAVSIGAMPVAITIVTPNRLITARTSRRSAKIPAGVDARMKSRKLTE
jgi:hypothetical protein